MEPNSSDLRTKAVNAQYVILVKRGNMTKYISRKFYDKKHMNCTVNIIHANKFDNEEQALKFWNTYENLDKELTFIGVKPITITYECTDENLSKMAVILPCKVGDTVYIVHEVANCPAFVEPIPFKVSLYDMLDKSVFLSEVRANAKMNLLNHKRTF